MRTFLIFSLIMILGGALCLNGCGSSEQSTSGEQTSTPQGEAAKPSAEAPPADTSKGHAPQQSYDSRGAVPAGMTAGKFSVQVGAYKQQDNADRVAAMARDRFGKNVYTIPDAPSGLIKVYVGEFGSKDEARKFRDEMALKFPQDYKDAWVSDTPSK